MSMFSGLVSRLQNLLDDADGPLSRAPPLETASNQDIVRWSQGLDAAGFVEWREEFVKITVSPPFLFFFIFLTILRLGFVRAPC